MAEVIPGLSIDDAPQIDTIHRSKMRRGGLRRFSQTIIQTIPNIYINQFVDLTKKTSLSYQ